MFHYNVLNMIYVTYVMQKAFSACDYNSGAGSGGHRFVSTPSQKNDQQLGRDKFSKSRHSAACSFSHTLSHLEPFKILLHCTTHGCPH